MKEMKTHDLDATKGAFIFADSPGDVLDLLKEIRANHTDLIDNEYLHGSPLVASVLGFLDLVNQFLSRVSVFTHTRSTSTS